ncbi:hypothetical protein OS493_006925 [Desmophyllum pertusum]|uniref:Uncharacterized protein n=1 Tax=Desmophyllum pertusum TaxID=174260 RepID=A0A9X0D559_9CNID|nr:hypothetical protein OS493_006925 [Desmophyllum pertusum]
MAENAVLKETAVSEQINKRSKNKWYLNHTAPCSVAPRRSQKILKRKLAASMCADGQISGNSSEAEEDFPTDQEVDLNVEVKLATLSLLKNPPQHKLSHQLYQILLAGLIVHQIFVHLILRLRMKPPCWQMKHLLMKTGKVIAMMKKKEKMIWTY